MCLNSKTFIIMPTNTNHSSILLFDGVCNLCNGIVQFVIKHDPNAKFKFASLQSEAGQTLLKKFGLKTNDFDTFVLVRGETYFVKSSAVLRVLNELGGVWKLFYAFIILPAPVRDLFYNAIAGSRYKLFGRRENCMLPSPELKQKFLD